MDWLEISLEIPNEDIETAAAIANMSVPYGIYIEDYSDLEQGAREIAHIDLIDEQLLERDKSIAIIHIYFSAEDNFIEAKEYLTEQLKAANIKFTLKTGNISESDWKDNWKQFFKVTEIGEKLLIVPSWEKVEDYKGRTPLNIDPGAAFGTGTHATTRLCLELLENYCDGASMVDIGCGSGILGIGAALLGAKKVIGVDIDAVAVKIANENATINNVQNTAKFIEGDLADKISGKFDIVCANIVADAIISLAPQVKPLLDTDGIFICSGIIDIRANEVEAALIKNGYTIVEHKITDNWHAFAVKM